MLLEYGKFFVDITSQSHFEINDFDLRKHEWTTVYKPLKLIEFIPGCQPADMNSHFLYYVKRFGIAHVRCGNYGTFELSQLEKQTIFTQLQRQDLPGNKQCFLCGEYNSHFTKDCITMQTRCYSCGKFGHEVDQCTEVRRVFDNKHYTIIDEENHGGNCFQRCCSLFC